MISGNTKQNKTKGLMTVAMMTEKGSGHVCVCVCQWLSDVKDNRGW